MSLHKYSGHVVITLSPTDFDELLTVLGYVIGMEIRLGQGTERAEKWMQLSNTINQGNPDWKPYDMETIKDLAFGGPDAKVKAKQ